MENPEPGWYPVDGGLRWWDGAAWGPMAPQPLAPPQPSAPPPPVAGPAPGSDEADKATAIVAHLGFVAGGFIIPLIVYLISRDKKGSFARHHAAEALNFQLTVFLISMIGFGAGAVFIAVSLGSSTASPSPTVFPASFFVVWAILMGLTIVNWVLSIIGLVKASQLKRWRYPIRIPFVGRGGAAA